MLQSSAKRPTITFLQDVQFFVDDAETQYVVYYSNNKKPLSYTAEGLYYHQLLTLSQDIKTPTP